jgi:hypothetical protein
MTLYCCIDNAKVSLHCHGVERADQRPEVIISAEERP